MIDQREEELFLNSKPSVELSVVKTTEEKKYVKETIEKYHSYVPSNSSVGRRIDWIIWLDDVRVGMIGIGSSVYPPPKDILRFLGKSKEQYRKSFNSVANNWRFCLSSRVKNLGTQVLRKLREEAPGEWLEKYGDTLEYLITFVGGGNSGAVYLADNWAKIGETAGLPKHRASSMKWNNKEELSHLFVKPTGENKKIIFIKKVGRK